MQPFSPPIKAFERLRASDGLLITADHWQRTQAYHRHRQNFYYQSLYQAGIVSGLGVTVISAPEAVDALYRNGRWIQVQPGTAIDAQGNPIVVTEPCVFQVQFLCTSDEYKTVFIVLNYVDPDELRHQSGQDWVRETFRIVEKTTLDVLDVELCRIQLSPGKTTLAIADNVFFPGPNSLDLNHRCSIRNRPESVVTLAQLSEPAASNATVNQGLTYLLKAIEVLYPTLAADPASLDISWDAVTSSRLLDYDCLYLSHDKLLNLPADLESPLKNYLDKGGVLLIAVDGENARQEELASIRQELVQALAESKTDPTVGAVRASVQAEISAIDAEIAQFTQTMRQAVIDLADRLGVPLRGTGEIAPDHPLRTTPFLFSGWPAIKAQPLQLFCWGGIVLMMGHLAVVWGPDETATRSRETIRVAHELGINLIYYAWRRRQLMQLQHSESAISPLPSPDSLTSQVTA